MVHRGMIMKHYVFKSHRKGKNLIRKKKCTCQHTHNYYNHILHCIFLFHLTSPTLLTLFLILFLSSLFKKHPHKWTHCTYFASWSLLL